MTMRIFLKSNNKLFIKILCLIEKKKKYQGPLILFFYIHFRPISMFIEYFVFNSVDVEISKSQPHLMKI